MSMSALETEMWWLPLLLTVVVVMLAAANIAPAGSAFAAFRNGALLAGAVITAAAVWLTWAAVLR